MNTHVRLEATQSSSDRIWYSTPSPIHRHQRSALLPAHLVAFALPFAALTVLTILSDFGLPSISFSGLVAMLFVIKAVTLYELCSCNVGLSAVTPLAFALPTGVKNFMFEKLSRTVSTSWPAHQSLDFCLPV